jgi:hypothetical protein
MSASADHFFIVGGQRCGTTYLCHLMDEHPQIEMAKPFRPEPKYFLQDVSFPADLAHYESTFFGSKPGARLRGEKSTSYMESRAAAERLAAWFPRAKIVFVLRDPIDRAMSHYWFSVENGLETLPMADAFRREEERRRCFDPARVSVSPFAYLSRGLYVDSLAMYEEFFPRDQIAVLLYEEMVGTVDAVQRLYAFLGVDPRFSPTAVGRRVNEGTKRSGEPPREVGEYLEAYFEEATARLAARLGKDLATWWRVRADSTSGQRRASLHRRANNSSHP